MWLQCAVILLACGKNGDGYIFPFQNQTDLLIQSSALSEIINALNLNVLIIFSFNDYLTDVANDFIIKVQKLNLKTCIFYDKESYFSFIEHTTSASIESSSLIFAEPFGIVDEILEKNFASRLSLFMFYWGALKPPRIAIAEPLRSVIITRPRTNAFRIFYNQAVPIGKNNLHLVNWYDANSLGLYKTPLLPSAAEVYSNFESRQLKVPVVHSPPWYFVNNFDEYDEVSYFNLSPKVLGGRDHQLLNLLSKKMNFLYEYVDPPGQTQGSLMSDENKTFTGAIGMIQNKEADILLGDVSLSWERRRAIEFSYFILADSGAFITRAPRKLNEALSLLRPFKPNVWPLLILTVVFSGPILYVIIIVPYCWRYSSRSYDHIYIENLKEITGFPNRVRFVKTKERQVPHNLFEKCVWLAFRLYLKQCSYEPFHGYRARFLIIIYWIAATYVLTDVYFAQLTSEFARPAREAPIDDLYKLENAMRNKNYKLFVEKDSSSLEILENSTEVFRRLYKLMKEQGREDGETDFLVNSVEEGIELILNDSKKVVLGGRETLYFNMKRYGLNNIQMSYKLYTRYSAIAVQIGCPFLESLNTVLMRLFEGGILDEITDNEYEKMSKIKLNDGQDYKGFATNNLPREPTAHCDRSLQPLNIRMLQGAFLILILGQTISGIVFTLEITIKRRGIVFKNILLHKIRILRRYLMDLINWCKREIIKFTH